MKFVVIALLFLVPIVTHAEEARSVKVPAPANLALNQSLALDSVCYNPNYTVGGYQNCVDDSMTLDIMSNGSLSFVKECRYVSQCGPWYGTYQMDIYAVVNMPRPPRP